MNQKPNEAQELCDVHASYSGDEDAYEDQPDDGEDLHKKSSSTALIGAASHLIQTAREMGLEMDI